MSIWRRRPKPAPRHAVPEEPPITLEQIHKLGLWAQSRQRELQAEWSQDDVLLARFTPTRYEIRENGAFCEVIRRSGNGGVLEWVVTFHSDPAHFVPDLVGVYPNEEEALREAAQTIDRASEENDDTRPIEAHNEEDE